MLLSYYSIYAIIIVVQHLKLLHINNLMRRVIMYVLNDIAYSGEPIFSIRVNIARALDDFKLWIRFNTGEVKIFDFKPLLALPAFAPLADEIIFNNVFVEHGYPVWNDGEIDIAPEKLYADGVATGGIESA